MPKDSSWETSKYPVLIPMYVFILNLDHAHLVLNTIDRSGGMCGCLGNLKIATIWRKCTIYFLRISIPNHSESLTLYYFSVIVRPCYPHTSKNVFNCVFAGKHLDVTQYNSSSDVEQLFYKITNRKDVTFGKWSWMSHFVPNMRMVNKFSDGRVFVAGGEPFSTPILSYIL